MKLEGKKLGDLRLNAEEEEKEEKGIRDVRAEWPDVSDTEAIEEWGKGRTGNGQTVWRQVMVILPEWKSTLPSHPKIPGGKMRESVIWVPIRF